MIIRIAGAIEVGLNRLGIKVGAIRELHPGMEFDGVNQSVRRDGVTLRQHILQLHLFIQDQTALIERIWRTAQDRVSLASYGSRVVKLEPTATTTSFAAKPGLPPALT